MSEILRWCVIAIAVLGVRGRLVRIEAKIDALNTCGPAEVVVSGEE